MRDQRADGGAQVVAVHDHIDHAVLVEIFGALEALGQLLADGLLDDARDRQSRSARPARQMWTSPSIA